MGIRTRTFPKSLSVSTTAAVTEVVHLRDMIFAADDEIGVYLQAIHCNLSITSFNLFKAPEYDGFETDAQKMVKFSAAEAASQKLGLKILNRKTGETVWRKKAEIILVNRGRSDFLDLLAPYLAQNNIRILETNDEIGIQLVDYGNGLLKANDSIEIEFALTIESEKKNDEIEALKLEVETLKLAINGRLTDIAPNHFLGREITTGVVNQIPFTRFATQSNIDQAIIDLVGGSPGALNTLVELAAALNNDNNFAATVTNELALKAPLTELAKYFPRSSYNTSALPNNYSSGIQGADVDLGEGLRGWHFITNLRLDNTFGFQIAICDGTQAIKYRRKSNNTWTVWHGVPTLSGNQNFTGFITLGGNVGLKNTLISGTTASTQGGLVAVAHGVNASKIKTMTGTIEYAGINTRVPIPGNQNGYQCTISHDSTNINITNVANNSGSILSLPFQVLIWYAE